MQKAQAAEFCTEESSQENKNLFEVFLLLQFEKLE